MIPQIIILVIGVIYMLYTSGYITLISTNYSTIKEKMIPALEKSEKNLLLLKQIANDFTFATLSSESDFLELPQKYNHEITQNLQDIAKLTQIDTHKALQDYLSYFRFTFALTKRMITSQKQYSEEMESVLTLFKNTQQDFIQINQEVQTLINNKTDTVSASFNRFHTNVLLFGLLLYLTITLITILIYKGLQKSFFQLITDISTIRQSGKIKEKLAQFSKNEFGLFAQELNAVFSEFNEAYENLENIANIDKLTQLYNRSYIDTKIEEMTKRDIRFGVILIDIDHFKKINDTYGHVTGDTVLQHFAKILRKTFPDNAIISRWGGEEFLVLLPVCRTPHRLQAHAETARITILTEKFKKVRKITASFGCTFYLPGENFKKTIERADKALYAAKAAGRNATKIQI